jgi:hypothetical protein
MQTKIEKLESKLKEVQSRISKEAFIQWSASATTKALLLRLQIDSEDLKDCWAARHFEDDGEETRAQGQVAYIDELPLVIKELGAFANED